jgi:RNase P subunit RPR2
MDTSTQPQDSSSRTVQSQRVLLEVVSKPYQLHERYSPATILEPRVDAEEGRIWCKHCQLFLVIGSESVSHQNLVRASQVCIDCGGWNYLDENLPVAHERLCASAGGEKVKLGWGGSQARATVVPPRTSTQEEAASWPHV